MAIYRVEGINYVVTGAIQKFVNLTTTKVATTGPNGRQIDDSRHSDNHTFLTDENQDDVSRPGFGYRMISNDYRTHRIRRLEGKGNYLEVTEGYPEPLDNDYHAMVNTLFDASRMIYQTHVATGVITDRNKQRRLNDYFHMFTPRLSSELVGVVQTKATAAYALTEPTTLEPYQMATTLRLDRNYRLSNDSGKMRWNFLLSSGQVDTFGYTPLSDLRCNSIDTGEDDYDPNDEKYRPSSYWEWLTSFGELSANRIPDLFDVKFNLSGMSRNYLLDMDLTDNRYVDFNDGVAAGYPMFTKNPWNAEYSSESLRDHDTKEGPANLDNTRRYTGIGQVGGRVFLKYYDETKVEPDSDPDNPVRVSCVISADAAGVDLQEIPVREVDTTDRSDVAEPERTYQNVEVVEAMNRGVNSSKHKSNLYRIRILDTGLYEDLNDCGSEQLLATIRADIQNSVRRIAERLQPAHTQLFDVEIEHGGTPVVKPVPRVDHIEIRTEGS